MHYDAADRCVADQWYVDCSTATTLTTGSGDAIPLEVEIVLGSHTGMNIQCEDSNNAKCANANTGLWERVKIKQRGSSYIITSMKSGNNLQCQADGACAFDNTNEELWEQWAIETKGDALYFVSQHTNKVMQCTQEGEIQCASENRLDHEAFRVVWRGDGISEYTYYGDGVKTRKVDSVVASSEQSIGRLALNGAGQHPEWSDSDVAEIIIYRRHLSDEERGQVEDYLSLKYGLCVGPSLRGEWSYVRNIDANCPPSLSVRLPPPVTVNKVPRIARIVESCHEYTRNTNAHALVSFDADVRPVARIAICFDKKSTSEQNYDYLQLLAVKAESKDDETEEFALGESKADVSGAPTGESLVGLTWTMGEEKGTFTSFDAETGMHALEGGPPEPVNVRELPDHVKSSLTFEGSDAYFSAHNSEGPSNYLREKFSGPANEANWPAESVSFIDADKFNAKFVSDDSTGDWGFRLAALPVYEEAPKVNEKAQQARAKACTEAGEKAKAAFAVFCKGKHGLCVCDSGGISEMRDSGSPLLCGRNCVTCPDYVQEMESRPGYVKPTSIKIKVVSCAHPNGNAEIWVNDIKVNEELCLGDAGGHHVAIIDTTGDVINVKRFDTGECKESAGEMKAFLESATDGQVIAFAINGAGGKYVSECGEGEILTNLGCTNKPVLNVSQACVGQKGRAKSAWWSFAEGTKGGVPVEVETTAVPEPAKSLYSDDKDVTFFESKHNYATQMDDETKIHFPGAVAIAIAFDPLCSTESGCDYLRFRRETGSDADPWIKEYFTGTGSERWPTEPVIIEAEKFFAYFHSDYSGVEWGYRFACVPVFLPGDTPPLYDPVEVKAEDALKKELLASMTQILSEAADGDEFSIDAVAISPDQTRVVTGNHDGSVSLWDMETGNELLKPRYRLYDSDRVNQASSFGGIAFSSDGGQIVMASSQYDVVAVCTLVGDASGLYFTNDPGNAQGGWKCFDPQLHSIDGLHDFDLRTTITTTSEAGTIAGKCFPGGIWRNGVAPDARSAAEEYQCKMLFVRGGRLCFDIGWVAGIEGQSNVADGGAHEVMLRFEAGQYHLFVDGQEEAAGLRAVPDPPDAVWVVGEAIGHSPGGGDCSSKFWYNDMAPAFEGTIEMAPGGSRGVEYRLSNDVEGQRGPWVQMAAQASAQASASGGGLNLFEGKDDGGAASANVQPVGATNANFGDPVPGMPKVLVVQMADGSVHTAKEHTAELVRGHQRIVRAWYGDCRDESMRWSSEHGKDVTAKFVELSGCALGSGGGGAPSTPPNPGESSGGGMGGKSRFEHFYALASQNYPNHTWLVVNDEEVRIDKGPSSALKVVDGLTGQEGTVSFEDASRPGWFLRHCNYNLRCHRFEGKDLYRKDATFHPRLALTGSSEHRSFESVNYPEHFICHRSYILRIAKSEDNDLHRNDASFLVGEGVEARYRDEDVAMAGRAEGKEEGGSESPVRPQQVEVRVSASDFTAMLDNATTVDEIVAAMGQFTSAVEKGGSTATKQELHAAISAKRDTMAPEVWTSSVAAHVGKLFKTFTLFAPALP